MTSRRHRGQNNENEASKQDPPSPELARRLPDTFGLIRYFNDYFDDQEYRDSFEAQEIITDFTETCRKSLGEAKSYETVTQWPDTEDANRPNAGWLYLEQNNEVLNVRKVSLARRL